MNNGSESVYFVDESLDGGIEIEAGTEDRFRRNG